MAHDLRFRGVLEQSNELSGVAQFECRHRLMVQRRSKSNWNVGQSTQKRKSWTRVKNTREKGAFSNAPLRNAHGLTTLDENFAGPTPGKTNHPVLGISLKRAGVH